MQCVTDNFTEVVDTIELYFSFARPYEKESLGVWRCRMNVMIVGGGKVGSYLLSRSCRNAEKTLRGNSIDTCTIFIKASTVIITHVISGYAKILARWACPIRFCSRLIS
jgi:hypothetical protein